MHTVNSIYRGLIIRSKSIYDLEYIGFLLLFVGSLVVLNPYTDVFTNSKSYELLRMVMSENFFGSLMFFIALLSLFSMIDGGLTFRRNVLALQALFWVMLFAAFLSVNLATFFPWFISIFALISIIPLRRISVLMPWIGHL